MATQQAERSKHTGTGIAMGKGGFYVRRAPDGSAYLVHATKPWPWVTRATNRRRNRAARASRKVNRGR